MKILFVAPRYHTNQHWWMKALQSDGHDVSFFVSDTPGETECYEALTPCVVPNNKAPFLFRAGANLIHRYKGSIPRTQFHYLPNRTWLEANLIKKSPDIIVMRDAASPLSISTHRIARRLGIPTILYNQHPLENSDTRTIKILRIFNLTSETRITPTRFSNATHNKKSNSFYVPLSTDFECPVTKPEKISYPVKLLTIGKLNLPRKKLDLLVDVLVDVRTQFDVTLTIAGGLHTHKKNETFQKLQDQIASTGMEQFITIKPNVPFTEVSRLYETHDAFVLPSVEEPYSISPLEAMNFGLPAIVTDTNGMRRAIQDESNGYIVRSNDCDDLKEKIIYLAEDLNRMHAMGEAAKKTSRNEFSRESFLKYFKEVLKSL